jgi:hypothetical protein
MLKFLETKSSTLSDNTFSEKFTGKKVLVIGAGPSVNSVSWENIEYDCIVTTTHFYLNDKVRNIKNIAHLTLSEIIDFKDERLHNFLMYNPSCTIALEPVTGRPFYSSETFLSFEEQYRERLIYYNTTVGKKEGAAGRLNYFVMSFNPAELYYVGIDGKSKDSSKDPMGTFRKIQGDIDGYSYDEFKDSHMGMADSLYKCSLLNGTNIYNLGEGFDFNCSSDYSKIHFPLTDEIKSKINKDN